MQDVTTKKQNKIVQWAKSHKRDIVETLCLSMLMMVVCFGRASALEIDGMNDLKGLAKSIVGALGFILALYGAIQFGLGMAGDNPDSQSRGIKMLVGGIIILGATVIVNALKLV